MYKYVSAFLAICLVVLGGMYVWQKHANNKREAELSNKLAKLEGVVKETETAYSVRGQRIEDLEAENKELQKTIDNRDEEVAALGQAVLKWKGQYFKIKNAKETVTDRDGNPATPDTPTNELRVRVDFDKAENYLRVHGFTLTNPAYAEVDVEWTRGLKLNFLLTKKGKDLKLYFDTNSPDIVVSDLVLKVDPSVFERKWYENVGVQTNLALAFGNGAGGTVGLVYDLGRFMIGPTYTSFLKNTEGGVGRAWGFSLTWFVFRK
jgi:hypothetical protein